MLDLLVFNCLTCLSLVWPKGVGGSGYRGEEVGLFFWRETGQLALRDPNGLIQWRGQVLTREGPVCMSLAVRLLENWSKSVRVCVDWGISYSVSIISEYTHSKQL